MTISQTSILSEIENGNPISLRTRTYYRRRLQNRIHRLISQTFKQQQKSNGLTQKTLAERIDIDKAQLNRWLGISGNWTLNTLSDLLLGMAVDLDDPSVTNIADLVGQSTSHVPPSEDLAAFEGKDRPNRPPDPSDFERMTCPEQQPKPRMSQLPAAA
ncbi:MAG TPA: helix-turn-helix transcriptional regulator [Candidatus Binataceae bacterium]|nr:helix-turn-helix transcriptional regulator [Candidatus Binataceae bacterium]